LIENTLALQNIRTRVAARQTDSLRYGRLPVGDAAFVGIMPPFSGFGISLRWRLQAAVEIDSFNSPVIFIN
jgi:hypothetical protein